MKPRVAGSLFGILGCLAVAAGGSARAAEDTSSVRFVFLGPARPRCFHVRVTIDKQPFRSAWREHLTTLFGDLDANKDQKLSPDEMAHAPVLADVGFLASMAAKPTQSTTGDVDLAGFLDHYARAGSPPFEARSGGGPEGFGKVLFELLDASTDQELSSDELRNAGVSLRRRDFDDDEILTPEELAVTRIRPSRNPMGVPETSALAKTSAIVLLETLPAGTLGSLLVSRYDTDGDLKLRGNAATAGPTVAEASKGLLEIDLSDDLFGRLDTDGDQFLTANELEAFPSQAAVIALTFALGSESAPRDRESDIEGIEIVHRSNGDYRIDLGDAHIEFRRNNGNPLKNNRDVFFFDEYDTDQNGYIDPKEASAFSPNGFAAMDRNGDQMIRKEEFQRYLLDQKGALASRIVLKVTEQGHELFDLLDDDVDGRLTHRELRETVRLLGFRDINGDQRLASREIPHKLVLEIARGGTVMEAAAGRGPRVRRSRIELHGDGPIWFVKMDRNRDGDVSPREFLGPLDVFQRLDLDGDGLIDADESASVEGQPTAAGSAP